MDHYLNPATIDVQCPKWIGDVPPNSLVMVFHTTSLWKSGGSKDFDTIRFNLAGLAVLAVPATACKPAAHYQQDVVDSEGKFLFIVTRICTLILFFLDVVSSSSPPVARTRSSTVSNAVAGPSRASSSRVKSVPAHYSSSEDDSEEASDNDDVAPVKYQTPTKLRIVKGRK